MDENIKYELQQILIINGINAKINKYFKIGYDVYIIECDNGVTYQIYNEMGVEYETK